MTPDHFNAMFEAAAAIFLILNIRKLMKDKVVKGVSILPVIVFTVWGFWNLYYYPSLQQWYSFVGGLAVVLVNSVWVVLAIYYKRQLSTAVNSYDILAKQFTASYSETYPAINNKEGGYIERKTE